MFGFFKRLFAGSTPGRLTVEDYWCDTTIKLSGSVQTPLGSRVTVVKICVDIHYSVAGEQITLHRVRMARDGGTIVGSNTSINVASDRTGEAWYTSQLCDEQYLVEAVENDLAQTGSRIHRIMTGKWREQNRGMLVKTLIDALNSQVSPQEIAGLIGDAGSGNEIIFVYSKPDGTFSTRHVTVYGVSGDAIRARDHKDDKVKSFRIDRITKASQPDLGS
jgi:hypothetical protein